jgi:4-hydroxybenzoate polyprenyltransferase
MAHKFGESGSLLTVIASFFAFSFTSSSVYVLNDLLDLESDRTHPNKRNRPFASGALSLKFGFLLAPILLAFGLIISISIIPINFLFVLFCYILLTSAYSFKLKRIAMVDIIVLAGLYTSRLIAGAEAANVIVSPWLLAFSMFLFLSLAIVKRYTELLIMQQNNKAATKGRGYLVSDAPLLVAMGTASGYISILIFALYINSADVVLLYKHPFVLWLVAPLLLFWISRIWLIAHRGKMHDDPIVFTGRDPASYVIGFIIAILVIGAAL